MAQLVGLDVKITKNDSGAVYPDFNQISSAIRKGLNWSNYIDSYGSGWCYNKVENIGKGQVDGNGDPYENACALVPEDFADAAVALFPTLCTKITEAQFSTFYDDKCAVYLETEIIDLMEVQKIAARVQLEQAGAAPAPSAAILALRAKRLDPADPLPGIRTNPVKTYAGWKAHRNFDVKPDA